MVIGFWHTSPGFYFPIAPNRALPLSLHTHSDLMAWHGHRKHTPRLVITLFRCRNDRASRGTQLPEERALPCAEELQLIASGQTARRPRRNWDDTEQIKAFFSNVDTGRLRWNCEKWNASFCVRGVSHDLRGIKHHFLKPILTLATPVILARTQS